MNQVSALSANENGIPSPASQTWRQADRSAAGGGVERNRLKSFIIKGGAASGTKMASILGEFALFVKHRRKS